MRSANFNTVIGENEKDVAARLDRIEQRVAPYLGDRTAAFMAEYHSDRGLVGTPNRSPSASPRFATGASDMPSITSPSTRTTARA